MSESSSRDTSRGRSSPLQESDYTKPSSPDSLDIKRCAFKSTFQRWRPSFHLQAPSGWMNDPCAPYYDPSTKTYHVSYQSNLDLGNADWGDIAWRSAKSSNLVTWTIDDRASLRPDTGYDGKGVFTGCKVPSRDNSLTCVYTSVSDLPTHHTLPHVVGSESLSMAKSFDSGKTWQKYAGNPILPSEPLDLNVTGWRDPYVSAWPSMAAAVGLNAEETLFGIISGGIRDITPTTFLYSIDASDLTNWQYIGPLVDFGLNLRPSRWSGDLGKNWEVTNFLTLSDTNDPKICRDFLVMGTEGCLPDIMDSAPSTREPLGPTRPLRGQLWLSGSLVTKQDSSLPSSSPVQMQFGFGGHLDHGCLYAANSFFDSRTSKHIVWGWITEEDLCDELRHEQGWSGLLSLPREISLQTLKNVVRARNSSLNSITSFEVEADCRGTYTLRTLASEPVRSVAYQLRQRATMRRARLSQPLPKRKSYDLAFTSDDVQTSAWELDCKFLVSKRCSDVGVQIIQSRDFSQATTLSFTPSTETFTIIRPSFPYAASDSMFNTAPEKAPHTLFTSINEGREEEELLHIQAWRDNSVLEVFVNGRTAISTRIYAAEETVGIKFYADEQPTSTESTGETKLVYASLWDGITAQ